MYLDLTLSPVLSGTFHGCWLPDNDEPADISHRKHHQHTHLFKWKQKRWYTSVDGLTVSAFVLVCPGEPVNCFSSLPHHHLVASLLAALLLAFAHQWLIYYMDLYSLLRPEKDSLCFWSCCLDVATLTVAPLQCAIKQKALTADQLSPLTALVFYCEICLHD